MERFHPDSRPSIEERITLLNERNESAPPLEEVYLTLCGQEVPVEVSAVPVVYEGQPGAVVFARDLASRKREERQRKEFQEQLQRAQKLESVGRLAGGVAHDFNNMLSVILGYTELARDKLTKDDPLQEDLREIERAAQRSAEITQQLLAFARKQPIAPRVLDLNQTVENVLKMLRRLIGEEIDLVWLPKSPLPFVRMDPTQIDQILANLCVNARDAISGHGRISIETDLVSFDDEYCQDHLGFVSGTFVSLSVSDNGSGMSPEVLEHMFEPFFTTKALGHGTGLGLATVYGIVQQNRGFIKVYSEVDKGTTIKIYLKAVECQLVDGKLSPAEMLHHGNGERILLVEDEKSILKLTKRILESLNYRVSVAGSPSEAMHVASALHYGFDLLVTDLIMPEMNGRELFSVLREHQPHLRCLFMSGYTTDVVVHQGLLDEGVHFIQKPFFKADFAQKIREALDK